MGPQPVILKHIETLGNIGKSGKIYWLWTLAMFCVYCEGLSSNEDKKKGWQGIVCLRIEELGICQGAAGCSSLGSYVCRVNAKLSRFPSLIFTGFTTPPSPSRWLSAASIQPSAEAITSKSVYVDSFFGRLQIRNLPLQNFQIFSILMGKHGKYIRWFQPSNLGQAPLSDKPALHDDILELNQTHEVVECQNQDFTNRNQWPGTHNFAGTYHMYCLKGPFLGVCTGIWPSSMALVQWNPTPAASPAARSGF